MAMRKSKGPTLAATHEQAPKNTDIAHPGSLECAAPISRVRVAVSHSRIGGAARPRSATGGASGNAHPITRSRTTGSTPTTAPTEATMRTNCLCARVRLTTFRSRAADAAVRAQAADEFAARVVIAPPLGLLAHEARPRVWVPRQLEPLLQHLPEPVAAQPRVVLGSRERVSQHRRDDRLLAPPGPLRLRPHVGLRLHVRVRHSVQGPDAAAVDRGEGRWRRRDLCREGEVEEEDEVIVGGARQLQPCLPRHGDVVRHPRGQSPPLASTSASATVTVWLS